MTEEEEALSEKDNKDAWELISYFMDCMEKYTKEPSGKATLVAFNHIAKNLEKTVNEKFEKYNIEEDEGNNDD